MQVNQDPDKPKSSFIKKITREKKFIVSTELYSRISRTSLEQLYALLASQPEQLAALENAQEEERRREIIRLGNYYLPEMFNQETGLTAFNPPKNVHAMVRGEGYCGDLYYVDLITEVLDSIGESIQGNQTVLDFGASSGRIVKTLSTVYPTTHFYGCDPNQAAIQWATEHLPKVQMFVSPELPPLPQENASFDLIYAISIWSHFAESSALEWMQEMHRVLKPGGYFLWTTHGFGSLAHYWKQNAMKGDALKETEEALEKNGFHFIDVFRGKDDWGVGKSNWGQAFISPSYVLKNMLPIGWKLCSYAHRRSEGNQDVYLFQKI